MDPLQSILRTRLCFGCFDLGWLDTAVPDEDVHHFHPRAGPSCVPSDGIV